MGQHLLSLPHTPRYSTFHHRTRKNRGENYPAALNAQVKEVKSEWSEFMPGVAWNAGVPNSRPHSRKARQQWQGADPARKIKFSDL
jgi:hypothetical protein